jgi:DNA-binding NarL/FixJ family response regulator
MPVILLSADLATSSKVSGAAARREIPFSAAMTVDRLCELAGAAPGSLVLLDLTFADLTVNDVVAKLRALARPPQAIVAFGPHVHEAKLVEAAAAGCDRVMSRGQFYAQVDELLQASHEV